MNSLEEDLIFRWMEVANPGIKCQLMHPNKNCFQHVIQKSIKVIRKSSKFYLTLYIVTFFFFQVRKIKNLKMFLQETTKILKKYFRSLMFMCTLVSSIAVYNCFSNFISFDEPTLKGKLYVWGSLLSSLSIFCEDPSRRQEIVYFVFVRAARSAYTLAKKRGLPSLPFQQSSTFVILFGLISYIFYEHPSLLKNAKSFEKLWGEKD